MEKHYDIFNPDPNEGVMCGDCGFIFPRKDLKYVQGGPYSPARSLCNECIKLRDRANKQGEERYTYPEPEKTTE